MPAPTALPYTSSVGPPRVELDTADEDFDLGYDPSSFDINPSRPPTANGTHSPDSPTLGSRNPSPEITKSSAESDEEAGRKSRFVEEMATPPATTQTLMTSPGELAAHHHDHDLEPAESSRQAAAGASPPRRDNRDSFVVNPATIPIRTSSSNAVAANGGEKERERSHRDSYTSSSASPTAKKSPKKHRSLGSVPEGPEDGRRYSSRRESNTAHPDERDWLAAQGHRNTNGHSPLQKRSSRDPLNLGKPPSQTFSQQPTLYHPAPPPPQMDPLRTVASDLIHDQSANWTAEKENILKGPFEYLEAHPGKDIRAQLIAAFNAWLRVPEPSLAIITKVVGMLHTASLLIDDVEDSSLLRRGVPAAHHIFGAAQTINSANYVYFRALQELLKLENPDVIQIYTDELLNLHRGQGMDLFWRDTLTCPSEDDYLEMVGNKTGGLFRLAIKLMCAESPSHNFRPSSSTFGSADGGDGQAEEDGKDDYIPLVNTIGLLFQILDDYRNLSDTTYTANKGLCEDLTEGKFSFPIIHAIRSDPTNLVLINILKQKTTDDEVKRFAVGYMERTGSFAYTRRVLRGLTKKAGGLVDQVDGGRGKGEGIKGILAGLRVDRHARGSQSV